MSKRKSNSNDSSSNEETTKTETSFSLKKLQTTFAEDIQWYKEYLSLKQVVASQQVKIKSLQKENDGLRKIVKDIRF